jgi:predicted RND superfamily exporter protein
MPLSNSSRLERAFAASVRARWLLLALYALLLPPSVYYAVAVAQDNSLDRLIVPSDPDFIATRAFEAVFGAGEFALLLAETDDPFAPKVIARVDAIERALQAVPNVVPNSALSIFRRTRAHFEPTPETAADFRRFVEGTDLLKRQGLVGPQFLAIGLSLEVAGPVERNQALAGIDAAIAGANPQPSPLRQVTPLGLPFVNAYLDESQRGAIQSFVLFAAFVVVLNLSLYRSWRTLLAFLVTLGVCLAFSVGYIGATGGMFTLVSPMVPMTILVTATATLVYMHSRYVERPPERSEPEHQIFSLSNKFLACTASIFATAVGFAALMISDIRPIREMGHWTAVGLAITWVVVFTLFPALQRILRTPTREAHAAVRGGIERFADWLPVWSYHWRWPLVVASLVLSAAGGVALFGLPGVLEPMRVLTNPTEYMNRNSSLYRDMQRLESSIPGMSLSNVWIQGGAGSISEPDVLTGLHQFQQALETDPEVGVAVGPTSILRLIRYLSGQGDAWPETPEERETVAAELEGMLSLEPMLQRFAQPHELAQAHLTVISRAADEAGFRRLDEAIRRHWAASVAANPALAPLDLQVVGLGPLHAKMAQSLVPTLVESFTLTVAVIFVTFLLVFRSGSARVMAMIPSLFAILVMFLVMRIFGMPLNVATILIASTVLGTSENDQIHFFYHFQEGRRGGSVHSALRYTLTVAGRAILYATLINAGGFLAFALSDLPPLRQFGTLAGLAFVLSMLADFTALPAALWILSRERPDPPLAAEPAR